MMDKFTVEHVRYERMNHNSESALMVSVTTPTGAEYRFGVRLGFGRPHPHPPRVLADACKAIAERLESAFNRDGTLTEKGRLEYDRMGGSDV